jgi:prevent-host-death family protein
VIYTITQARKNFEELLRKVRAGEEVIIARGKKPVAKIVPFPSRTKKRVPGSLKGKIWYSPDAFDPLSKKELAEWGIE